MKPFKKNYIECRFYIIGDREVGKKSFIDRLLGIPSTSLLRNLELEEEIKSQISKLLKENELSDEEYYSKINKISVSKKDNSQSSSQTTSKITNQKTSLAKTRNIKFRAAYNFSESPQKDLEEKKNKMVMKSLVRYQVISNRFKRPPIPEYPSKLFNVNKTKIVIKPYYIFPGEEVPEINENDENTNPEYIIDTIPKITMKGIINDLYNLKNKKTTIINLEKLSGYSVYIYNFFIFLYDLSDFNSFETMKKYFEKINDKFNITNIEENSISCIIGNKKDKKIKLAKEQEIKFNKFIKSFNNLYLAEISSKPFYNFDKFFYDLFFTILSKYHDKLFSEQDFRSNFETVSLNRTTFSKGIRQMDDPYKDNPGPIYDINTLYRYISPIELTKAFHDKKKRFNQKIFENKEGPVFGKAKKPKDFFGKIRKDFFGNYLQAGGILNGTPKGFSFGTVDGKLNLIKTRKNLLKEINKNIRDSFEDGCVLYELSPRTKPKNKDYFDLYKERKEKYLEDKSTKNKDKNEINFTKNKNNLKMLELQEEQKRDVLRNKLQLFKSSSTPNMLSISKQNKTNKEFYKEHLSNILYPKLHDNLARYMQKRSNIIKNMQSYQTPGPNAYDTRNNMLNPKKGAIILERRKPIEFNRADPKYPDFKDEFDMIVINAQKNAGLQKQFSPRFKEVIKDMEPKIYKDSDKWKKWEKNREKFLNTSKIKKFLDDRKEKLKLQKDNQKKIEKDKKEIEEITRVISMQKGYGDPLEIKTINYSLVEESSPKYSMKGKHLPRTSSYDDLGNLFLNESEEVINAIVQEQMTRPLPDFKYIRPNIPGIVFSRAERFKKLKNYEGSEQLFQDGVFSPKTQEEFFLKEPFSNKSKRTSFGYDKKNWPSPAEYSIKGYFDILVEKGKKISSNRNKMRHKENANINNNPTTTNNNNNNNNNNIVNEVNNNINIIKEKTEKDEEGKNDVINEFKENKENKESNNIPISNSNN